MTCSMLTVNLTSGVHFIADRDPADDMAVLGIFWDLTFVRRAFEILEFWSTIAWKLVSIGMEAFVTVQNNGVVLTREISFGDTNLRAQTGWRTSCRIPF